MGTKVENNSESSKFSDEKFLKRNKFKFFGYHLDGMLYYGNPTSTLRKSYRNSFYCCNHVEVTPEGLAISLWCKNRWCPLCQRNKMGVMINTYGPRLQKEKELWFVTLTLQNVTAKELRKTILKYQRLWREIANTSVYRKAMKNGVIGIRKMECTYHGRQYLKDGSPDSWFGTFHPHIHLLLSSKELANFILLEWQRLNPECSALAQDIRQVENEGGYLEIFKYFTKLIAKDSSGKRYFDAVNMDVIFRAMQGRRVYFRLGSKSAWGCEEVKEEDIEQAAVLDTDAATGIYQWVEGDDFFGYYDIDTGETLTELPKKGRLFDIITESERRLISE